MLRRYVSTALLSGSLLFGSLFLASSPSTLLAKAVGEFATITAVDARTGIATLQTQGGETDRQVSTSPRSSAPGHYCPPQTGRCLWPSRSIRAALGM